MPKTPKPRLSDVAVFAADLAEVSPTPSITTDVLEWIFTNQPFPELPPRLQSLILRQGPAPYVELWSSDPDHRATRFIWDGFGRITHATTPGLIEVEWSDAT